MRKPLLDSSNALYDEAFARGKNRHSRVCWDDASRQYHRFAEIYRSMDASDCSVLDVGCGNGEFLRFLHFMGFTGSYTGVDINDSLLNEARESFPSHQFIKADILTDRLEEHDVVVMSGLFNLNFGQDISFAYDFVATMYSRCKHRTIFNALTSHVNFREESMFYLDPSALMSFIITNISPRVEIRHGFVPYNYTVSIPKGPTWHPLGGAACADEHH